MITASIWFCLTPLAKAQDQCLAPQIDVEGGNCNDCFTATVRVTNLNDPVNGIVNIQVTFSTDGAGGVCPIAPQVPSFITGTATFSFEVGREGCCTCGAGITFTDACCGSSTNVSFTSFSRPDNHIRRDFSISSKIAGAACTGIISVDIEPIALGDDENKNRTGRNDNKKIESFLDINPDLAGGGKRIFPDWTTYKDVFDRKTVRVRVRTSASFPDNTTIYFKSFDVDDPTDDSEPVDRTGPNGNDNRVENNALPAGQLNSQFGNSKNGNVIAKTKNGVATATFEVGMHPGNNYRIAASLDPIADSTFQPASGSTEIVDTKNKPLPSNMFIPARSKASPLLTVWRKLHVEVDAMNKVESNIVTGHIIGVEQALLGTELKIAPDRPTTDFADFFRFSDGKAIIDGITYNIVGGFSTPVVAGTFGTEFIGKICILMDDDDFNQNQDSQADNDEKIVPQPETFKLLQTSNEPSENVFAKAFIMPVLDGGETIKNNKSDLIFFDNIDSTNVFALKDQIEDGRGPSINEDDNYWVVYIQLAYQGAIFKDKDPNGEQGTSGSTPMLIAADDVNIERNGSVSVPIGSYGSLIFLETAKDADNARPNALRKLITVPHEIGHQMGLLGDKENFGIMTGETAPDQLQFIPRHIDVLRWRVKSPGQK